MTTYPNIGHRLDGARYVLYDEDAEIICAWFGGHGVHAYTLDGFEVAFWNVGDFALNDADIRDVEDSMKERIRQQDYVDFS